MVLRGIVSQAGRNSNLARLLFELIGESPDIRLTQGLLQGEPQDSIIRDFAKKMGVSLSSVGRLIATESAFFATKGELDNMKELGVEKYQFVATLDRRTSEVCRSMDMKIIPMKDFQPGVTAPPLHCWCRSCTVPYVIENPYSLRAARDGEGNTTYIPGNMEYSDWKAVFVDKKIPLALYLRKTPGADIIKEKVLSGEISLTVNPEKQGRHDKSSPLYIPGRSYMLIPLEEIQDIVNQYAGTGARGESVIKRWNNKEIIEVPEFVGVNVNPQTKEKEKTNYLTIHYSKTGVHVVPAKPKKERDT